MTRPPLARAPIAAYAGLFATGLVAGLVELAGDRDTTSTGASVAVANAVHVVIAGIAAAALARAWRRDAAGLRRWLRTPVTRLGWRRSLDALAGLPIGLAQVGLLAGGRRDRVARIEAWRAARLGAPARDRGRAPAHLARRVVGGLPAAAVGTLAAVLTVQAPLRAGEQVFAALDPDFTRDAWGGPGYLGASLAHWMDGLLLFAAASVVIGLVARRHGPA